MEVIARFGNPHQRFGQSIHRLDDTHAIVVGGVERKFPADTMVSSVVCEIVDLAALSVRQTRNFPFAVGASHVVNGSLIAARKFDISCQHRMQPIQIAVGEYPYDEWKTFGIDFEMESNVSLVPQSGGRWAVVALRRSEVIVLKCNIEKANLELKQLRFTVDSGLSRLVSAVSDTDNDTVWVVCQESDFDGAEASLRAYRLDDTGANEIVGMRKGFWVDTFVVNEDVYAYVCPASGPRATLNACSKSGTEWECVATVENVWGGSAFNLTNGSVWLTTVDRASSEERSTLLKVSRVGNTCKEKERKLCKPLSGYRREAAGVIGINEIMSVIRRWEDRELGSWQFEIIRL